MGHCHKPHGFYTGDNSKAAPKPLGKTLSTSRILILFTSMSGSLLGTWSDISSCMHSSLAITRSPIWVNEIPASPLGRKI